MDNPIVKGDEVRHGTHIFLDAITDEVVDSFGDMPLSETTLHQLHDGIVPIFPMTAKQVLQSVKDSDGLTFALCLRTDKTCIGVCHLGDISWQARHTQLHIAIIDEAHFTVKMLADVIQTMLQFAYWEANLNRICVHCVEDNTLLREALEHSGFTSEGQLRQEVYRNGRYLDKFIYSILQREWSG